MQARERFRARAELPGSSGTAQAQLVTILERVSAQRGLPRVLQVDNGPEFASQALDAWAHHHGVKLAFSRPGAPTDDSFMEAFNGRDRQECLDQQWCYSLEETRESLKRWRQDYNTGWPHTAIGRQTPAAFKVAWQQQQPSEDNG